MIHHLKLWPDSFKAIKEGWKTIEMRLYDEKRKLIKIGDVLEFQCTETNELLECVVLKLERFSDFKELYASCDKLSIGYKENEVANFEDMYAYYSKDKIQAYGALAIHICRKENITPKLLIDHGICPTCFNRKNQDCLYGNMADKLIYSNDQLECFFAGNPRAKGHTIISTKEHYKNMLEAPNDLVLYIYSFAHKAMKLIKQIYECECVYLCTMCDGPMNHFHVQLIPRYKNEPRGSNNFVKPRKVYEHEEDKILKLRSLLKEE